MTVTVPEVLTPDVSGFGTSTVALSSTLVSSDVVVAVCQTDFSSNSMVASGLGTWTVIFDENTNASRTVIAYCTGVTGSGSVTLTNNTVFTGRGTLYVLRGIPTFAATEQHSAWDTALDHPEYTPAQPYGADCVAIMAAAHYSSSPTLTFPYRPRPSYGWTVDRADYTAHRVGTASDSKVIGGVQLTSPGYLGVVVAVFGVPVPGRARRGWDIVFGPR